MKMTGLLLCFNTVLLLNPQGLDSTPVGGWSLTGKMERFLGQLLWERSLSLRKEIGTAAGAGPMATATAVAAGAGAAAGAESAEGPRVPTVALELWLSE